MSAVQNWLFNIKYLSKVSHTVTSNVLSLTNSSWFCGLSGVGQRVSGVPREGEKAAEWSGSCDRPTPQARPAQYGPQDEPDPTHQQDPAAAGGPIMTYLLHVDRTRLSAINVTFIYSK